MNRKNYNQLLKELEENKQMLSECVDPELRKNYREMIHEIEHLLWVENK